VLDDSGIVRSDIRSSFGSSTTTAEGVPLEIKLTVRDAATGDVLEGAGVYLWHCDRDGNYSLYGEAATAENYLLGAQEVDAAGTASFTSIFPACYSGRWPHVHFEVYAGLSDATSSGPIVKTSQIAMAKEACEAVYATTGYEQSVSTCRGSAWPATWSSATTAASTSSPPCPGTPTAAMWPRSPSAYDDSGGRQQEGDREGAAAAAHPGPVAADGGLVGVVRLLLPVGHAVVVPVPAAVHGPSPRRLATRQHATNRSEYMPPRGQARRTR
jgi:hypothetical protein